MNVTAPAWLVTTASSGLMKTITFSWYDYMLFSGMLGLSALIGVYFGCFGSKQSTADEYLMGSKKMKVFPIAVSLVASHVSGLTLMAIPADVYRFGAAYVFVLPALAIVCSATICIYLPVFYKMQCTSTYEYLHKRFDYKCRMLGSLLFTLTMFIYLPIVVYIPALAFSAATGLSVHVVTPIVCGVCVFYTTLGGLKAVVWTDTLQFIVTLGALATVFTIGIRSAGGFAAIVQRAYEHERLDIFDFDLDLTKRDTFWLNFIGLSVLWIGFTAVNQSCVQKFLSVATLKEAKWAVVLFATGMCCVTLVSIFTGLIMFARYYNCDPFTAGAIKKPDQMLPYYVMDVANNIPGLPGLFIAGIFCAGLSTLSAHLNCLAGTMYEDFISKILNNPSEKKISIILKSIVLIAGIICIAVVYIVDKFEGVMQLSFIIAGMTNGPTLALFTVGMLFPFVNSNGAFYGTIASVIFSGITAFGNLYYRSQNLIKVIPKPISINGCDIYSNISSLVNSVTTSSLVLNPTETPSDEVDQPFVLFRVSFYCYSVFGVIVCILVSFIVSFLTKRRDDPAVDKDLLSPIIYRFLSADRYFTKNKLEYFGVNDALQIVTNNSEKQ